MDKNNNKIINNCFHDLSNQLFVLKSIFDENISKNNIKWSDFTECKNSVFLMEKVIKNYKTILLLNSWNFENNQRVNVSCILRRFINLFKNEKNAQIKFDLEDDIYVKWNEDFFDFLVSEIVENAVLYSEKDSEVKIDLKATSSKALLLTFTNKNTISDEEVADICKMGFRTRYAKENDIPWTWSSLCIIKKYLETIWWSVEFISWDWFLQFKIKMSLDKQ